MFKEIESILKFSSKNNKTKSVCIISVKDECLSIYSFILTHNGISLNKFNEILLSQYSSMEQKREVIKKTLLYWSEISYNKAQKVYVLYPFKNAAYQTMIFPKIPKGELQEAIKLKLNLGENAISYNYILREYQEDNKNKLEVCVLTLEESKINELINIIENAGFSIDAIIPEATVLSSLFSLPEMENAKGGCLFLQIDDEDTPLIVYNDGAYSFSRRLNIGKKTFKNDLIGTTISDEGQAIVNEEKAAKIMEELGIITNDSEGIFEGIKYSQIKVLQRPVLERLLNELYRTFDYFAKINNGSNIKKVYLLGSSYKIKHFKDFLESELKTEVINLEEKINVLNNYEKKELVIPLAVLLDQGSKINLLPKDLIYRPVVQKLSRLAVIMSAALLVFFIILTLFYEIKIILINNNIKKMESSLQVLNPSLVMANKLENQNKEYQLKKDYFKELLGKDILGETFFIEISNLVPDDVVLKSLSINQNIASNEESNPSVNVNIEGLVFSGKPSIADNLAKLMINLERSPLFSDIKLQYAKINNDYNVDSQEFKIIAKCNFFKEES